MPLAQWKCSPAQHSCSSTVDLNPLSGHKQAIIDALLSDVCFRSTQIKTYSWDNAQVILVGNKCDMEEERVVSVDSGRLLAEQLGERNSANMTVIM